MTDTRKAVPIAREADPTTQTLTVGGNGKDGNLDVLSADNQPVLRTVRGTIASTLKHVAVRIGGGAVAGLVQLFDRDGTQTVHLNGASGSLNLVGSQIALKGRDNNDQIILSATSARTELSMGAPQRPARFQLTTGGNPGPTIEIDGERNSMLFLKKGSRSDSVIELNGNTAMVRAGGFGSSGELVAQTPDGLTTVAASGGSGMLRVGGGGRNGVVSVRGATGTEKIRVDAASGDIMLSNADCAEEFDLGVADVEPGTVLVLDDDGRLVPSTKPYDTRVAGVVSGAGSYRPGLVLDRRDTGHSRAPIALMGKVYCMVDASEESVGIGDLLTTAETPGHAMRLSDRGRATGAIVGKALAPLHSGRGLVPVLVLPG